MELKLTSGTCTCGLSFALGPVDLINRGSSRDPKELFQLRDLGRSSDREVSGPCRGRGSASLAVRFSSLVDKGL